MKAPDPVPLPAWIMWELFFDEPEPTDAGKDEHKQELTAVKAPSPGR